MNEASSHWGSLEIGIPGKSGGPLRNLVKVELSDTRAFIDRLYADYTRTARRAVTSRLIESRGSVPWFIPVSMPGRLTRR